MAKSKSVITGPIQTSFDKAALMANARLNNKADMFEYGAQESVLITETEFVSFHTPSEILISRHFPGYRMFDLSGKNADETMGLLLAHTLDSERSLETFRNLLASPDIAQSIISILLPRLSVPVKRGKYIMSEKMIADATATVLEPRSHHANIVTAISHVMIRVMTHMGLVLPGSEKKFVATSDSLAMTMSGLKKVIMIESLRDIFSEARITDGMRSLDSEATPNLIGEVVGKILRSASHVIPEIRLRLEQLDIVQSLIQHYYRSPESLTNTMRASSTLSTLASYANFLADAVNEQKIRLTKANNSDMRDACEAILTILQAAPSIEAIPLSRYAEFFGTVPCSSTDGVYRGLVVYMPMAQVSNLDIVSSYKSAGGAELSLVPNDYVPATILAGEIAKTITASESFTGLANLVADEIATRHIGVEERPILRTIGVDSVALIYLAMAASATTAVSKVDDETRPFHLIYAVQVAEHWRTWVDASSPDVAYFSTPQSVLIYQSGSQAKIPSLLPARQQSIDLSANYDVLYQGDIMEHLSTEIERPFSFNIEMKGSASHKATTLRLRVTMLELLMGTDPDVDRGGAHFASVREPGVDRDVTIALSLAAAYASNAEDVMSDKAKSWIVEVLTPLATHPAVTRLAVRALNQAVIAEGLDARSFAPQYKEAVVRAYFGTMLSMMLRFDKIDEPIVEAVRKALPVNSLSVKAALSLATMPTAINASNL